MHLITEFSYKWNYGVPNVTRFKKGIITALYVHFHVTSAPCLIYCLLEHEPVFLLPNEF